MNKYLEIVIILAFLSIILVSLKLVTGQSGNNLTMNKTKGVASNQTEVYRDTLMDVIKNANITLPSDLHPTTKQIEQIVDEIVSGGHPSIVFNEIRQNMSKQLP